MTKFESYHPIFTAHLELDWLTTTSLGQITQLLNGRTIANVRLDGEYNASRTADLVNDDMRQIMQSQALIWAVKDKQTQVLLGIFAITNLANNEPQFNFIFEVGIAPDFISELFDHMIQFTFKELKQYSISLLLNNNQHNLMSIIKTLGFSQIAKSAKSSRFQLFQ
ncbi:hypothetical protein [Fructilactobacillus fructivorans]|uniref:Uncharacterized protein n=1 Tax=Fructilactobacillus fructivorans TaxID=1614 RepID=A0AAE6NZU3_9LACO|nr:hypothetical protein [Fructilactobacillus fructivorans]KRK57193.1 hypothetical protein FC73_GL001231 [Fructilactobacillus fructivorans]KRN12094.1 hypothetical protein IV37_GL001319 [Fructilactobacillus fructivorans]KRN40438.1 hypothetical protein IV51_GL000144 [Fructilactobacillus fructivorans]KRN42781.1 hypothetical protein IV48_GL001187 [Fructilactobacillus fructivorans]QFX92320.1 hypothetical protein LF543_01455 [Fructilactobacillus fructivorans]